MKQYLLVFICCLQLSLHASSQDIPLSVDVSWYDGGKRFFVLSSEEQMMGLSDLVAKGNDFSGKTIFLSRDVDLSRGVWQPIGNPSAPFSGVFDGGLSNVVLGEMASGTTGGLFGYVVDGTIKNVSVSITSTLHDIQTFGVVAGYIDNKSIIENCSHVQSLTILGAFVVGGIVGSSDGYVNGCSNRGDIENVKSNSSTMGGIVGTGTGIVENSSNKAKLMGATVCGGIMGKSRKNGEVTQLNNCHNEGEISARSEKDNPAFKIFAGGIGGELINVEMMECHNKGKVTAYSYKDNSNSSVITACAGGLIGVGAGKFSASYNVGNVASRSVINVPSTQDGSTRNDAGGIIGYNTAEGITEMEFCYNAGSIFVFGQAPKGTFLNYGGLVGGFENFMPKLTGCYSVEGCCAQSAGDVGFNVPVLSNMEIVVPAETMRSNDFLQNVPTMITLNDCDLYLYDSEKSNNGYPVLKKVVSEMPLKDAEGSVTLQGASELSGKKYFHYWITGLEQFKVDVLADEQFKYHLGKLDVGEHNFQAYVVTPQGETIRGELVKFSVNK